MWWMKGYGVGVRQGHSILQLVDRIKRARDCSYNHGSAVLRSLTAYNSIIEKFLPEQERHDGRDQPRARLCL